MGARLLAARFPALNEHEATRALRETLDLMHAPALAGLFQGDARTEVAIAGRVTFNGQDVDVSGRIDRLVVTPTHVTLIDFKTGRAPDDVSVVPQGVVEQLGVYRMLLANLYPCRSIAALVVWTQIGVAVPVPDVA